ncbi:MAG: helix-turn-helix domain-containing protein [Oscillospiraceae bacterium]
MTDVGFRIKAIRKYFNITQKEFAKRILVTASYVSRIENGNELPTDKLLKLISLEFGNSLEWLLTGKGEMFSDERSPLIHDKDFLNVKADELNQNLQHLLATNSNFEYAVYAYSINLMTQLFTTFEQKLSRGDYAEYIQHIEEIIGQLYFLCLNAYENDSEVDNMDVNSKKEKLNDRISTLTNFLKYIDGKKFQG